MRHLKLTLFVLLFIAAIILTGWVGPTYLVKLGWVGQEALDAAMVARAASALVPTIGVLVLAVFAVSVVFVAQRDWLTADRELLWSTVCVVILFNPTHATPYLLLGLALCLGALTLPALWIVAVLRERRQSLAATSSRRSWEQKVEVLSLVVFACYLTVGWTHHGMVQKARAVENLRGALENLIDANPHRAVVLVHMPGFSFMRIDRGEGELLFSMHDRALSAAEAERARLFVLAHGGSTYVSEIMMMEGRKQDLEIFEVCAAEEVDVAFQLVTDVLHEIYSVPMESIEVEFLPEGL